MLIRVSDGHYQLMGINIIQDEYGAWVVYDSNNRPFIRVKSLRFATKMTKYCA